MYKLLIITNKILCNLTLLGWYPQFICTELEGKDEGFLVQRGKKHKLRIVNYHVV